MTSAHAIRAAILAAPFELDNRGETPHPGTLYIPLAHRKALARDAVLVVGARGVGKSFWTAALRDAALRSQIGESVPELTRTDAHIGYAATPNIAQYPDRATFAELIQRQHSPYQIWQAVVLRWLAALTNTTIPTAHWDSTVAWVASHAEEVARITEAANQHLASHQRFGLIIFDALDRTSSAWDTMNDIVRDLLQVALWLRDFPHLRAKVFLRPDQMERSVTAFVDASKILATRAELTWERHDLHAMMWQRLINAPDGHGESVRQLVNSTLHREESLRHDGGAWRLPPALTAERPCQRGLFEALAGNKMGKDARRGVPYVWSVSHLADGHGWTSPRSFLAAIHGAADDSQQRYADYALALHYESIKRGIQRASQIRVDQVAEDDLWAPEVMYPLKGMNVPCAREEIVQVWKTAFPAGPGSIPSDHLPPQHKEQGWCGIEQDLVRLGIFVTRKDGRIDMPDLYRVGFGLGRMGGVKPGK